MQVELEIDIAFPASRVWLLAGRAAVQAFAQDRADGIARVLSRPNFR